MGMAYIDVNKEKEKALYRVFKELESNGKSIIDSNVSLTRKIGVRGHKLYAKELLLPPAHIKRLNKSVVITPPNVEIKEISFTGNSRFVFRRTNSF